MQIILIFLAGFFCIFLASSIPGMINMTAVSVSIKKGVAEGRKFTIGAALAYAIHASIALIFADFLSQNPRYFIWIKSFAVGIFLILAASFLWQGLHPKPPKTSTRKGASFQVGFFLSAINALAITYFFAVGGYLLSNEWMLPLNSHYLAFVLGVVSGAFSIFQVYLYFSQVIVERAVYLARNINFFLAGLFVVLALLQIIQLATA